MKPTAVELLNWQVTAELAARLGGAVLQSWAGRFNAREKKPADLVTEADLASQAVIAETVRARYPEHGFLGEEGQPTLNPDSDVRWIVDPLDGTTNYVHGFPYYAVSIGVEVAGELVVGVVYDPTRNDLFSAAKGQGAKLNGHLIRVSDVAELRKAMLVASIPVAVHASEPAVARFLAVLQQAQTVQRTGSAAMNLAYVACGRLDGFWSTSLKPWDMAGGAVLVREAGGFVSDLNLANLDIETGRILATGTNPLSREVSTLIA